MLNITDYNPDVLSCIANLSSDEVFTPPQVVNQMLDMLPQSLFSSKDTTFLDPASKSGVFLREIAKRLIIGLEKEIPDLQERLNHIYSKQLFGIAITELTALLSRRSLYCSKQANGKYSVCEIFDDQEGMIIYENNEHTWDRGRCIYCGANEKNYDRGEELENHAYTFIHTENPEEIYNMKFDVIIGNPPYHIGDGGGEGHSTIPLYNRFVEQAIKMQPTYICMIIPARWYSGGKGLDSFREKMLNDNRILELHDFPETKDCFPGLNIRGGVCYFLWSLKHSGPTKVYNYKNGVVSVETRPLNVKGLPFLLRYNKSVSIINKVLSFQEPTFDTVVMARNVFRIPSNFQDYSKDKTDDKQVLLFRADRSSRSLSDRMAYTSIGSIKRNIDLKEKIKVIVSKTSPGGDDYPHSVLTEPIIAPKGSVFTETYLLIKICSSQNEAENLVKYMSTRFFRFMLSLVKNTQNISRNCFQLVPIIDLTQSWSDEKLYHKYKLTQDEIDFIESMIRPMELENA